MLRGLRRKLRRKEQESAPDEPPLEERLAVFPDDVATRLVSLYRGEPQRGTDGELHELDGVTRIPVAQALQLFPYVVLAVKELEQGGIGRKAEQAQGRWRRGTFAVREVWAENPHTGERQPVLKAGDQLVQVPDVPITHAQVRFTMALANQGFSGRISHSANTSRGSRFGGIVTLVPSGKTAASGPFSLKGSASA